MTVGKKAKLHFNPLGVVRMIRRLPIAGVVLVAVGDKVTAETVVARAEIPGYPVEVNVALQLAIEPFEISRYMQRKIGASIGVGEVLARRKTFLGLSEDVVLAPVAGTLEGVSEPTGCVVLRTHPLIVGVRSFVPGEVVEILPHEGCIVEARGAHIEGLFGVGGECVGPLQVVSPTPQHIWDGGDIGPHCRGRILVAGGVASAAVLQKARAAGVRGLILGSLDDAELASFLGHEIGLNLTGQEEAGLTIVVTDGFGRVPMADETFALLKECEGEMASLNGTTQIRTEAVRPEIFVARSH